MHKQIFELSYFSNGAVNVTIAYELPIHLRNFYYKQLQSIKEEEANQYKSKPSSQNKISRPF